MAGTTMLTIYAYAKINLYLDVISRYPDGYHQIESVMQSVSLHDLVEVAPIDTDTITVTCSHEELSGPHNLAYKAAQALRSTYNAQNGAKISITKRIPMAAGLAGGSADAAATLVGLNELWGLKLELAELQHLGIQLGADIPFCLAGGTMLAEGKGEVLSKLQSMPNVPIVIVTPPIHVSTADIYRAVDTQAPEPLRTKNDIVIALESGDIDKIAESSRNLLETVAVKRYPAISRIKQLLVDAGAKGALMSGSGPSIIALCADNTAARRVAVAAKKFDPAAFVEIVEPVTRGVCIEHSA
ncbi:MAG TPA: 4-(cytidine 5'-diphospho)-2-C-methyl-D-erythritol kinase [Candidatus Aquicultor sp.]|jgi:4-diphosphocytidyl-2-C-methyl-D-erythritol kinase